MNDRLPMVSGFRANGVHCGVKSRGLDLALLVSDVPATVAGVFTSSQAAGAPVLLTRKRVSSARARAVVVNSGIANVATGSRGRRDAEEMARVTGRVLECPASQVLVASTGVIGVPLPMARLRVGIERAARKLAVRGLHKAARAIMTTDTVPKCVMREVSLGERTLQIAGIAKGAGMIEPNMATMLAFLMSDAPIDATFLRRMLRRVVDRSFNRISVDGEMSTSDMVLLLANGTAGGPMLSSVRNSEAEHFEEALLEVCVELAQAIARDGEGATKLVTVRISGALNILEAERLGRRVANSLLVKTALYGCDPNWGRILQTLAATRDATVRPARLKIAVGGVDVFRRGAPVGLAATTRAAKKLLGDEVAIEIDLGLGSGEAILWTCDLSHEYITANAEYTT